MTSFIFTSKQAFQSQSEFSQQQTWYSGTVTNQEVVTMSQAQTVSDVSTLFSSYLILINLLNTVKRKKLSINQLILCFLHVGEVLRTI